ncbi:DUF4855 domain-containing protein [Paenibacillus sp. VCA1]|uniref:DUF4855 domain-containing protein n=1 Tax=Paenibacillus sp. VCA1 TaxID=3039148 RepID=UPI00287234C5|nr:DUF4855 domain-containing protein [Paenibacillus sp. VCA1]MDR9855727.1 DUF4855 domain-containing protein [Paenibacillus sp. VCA1]
MRFMGNIGRKLLILGLAGMTLTMNASMVKAGGDQAQPRNLAAGLKYTLSENPEDSYPDRNYGLTDGVYDPTLTYTDPAWQGHLRGKVREVVFDLGELKSVSEVKAHFMQHSEFGIFYPNTVSMYVSMDGKQWGTLANVNTKIPIWEQGPATDQFYQWTGKTDGVPSGGNTNAVMAQARYVKVTFVAGTFAFLDEIEVWGVDGKANNSAKIPVDEPAYAGATGGISNLALLYNGWYDHGEGDWTKEKIIPYISYVDTNGQPKDWLYDGVLYLGLYGDHWSGNYGTGTATLADWKWYLDKTFAPEGDLKQLDEATKETAAKLGDPKHKTKVVLMIPHPGETLSDFGDVDGDGISENMVSAEVGKEAALANREKAVKWYMNELRQRWSSAGYSHLELTGMYWLAESVGDEDDRSLVQYASQLVHKEKKRFYWIPYFYGNQNYAGKQLGFDVASLQPNYFFDEMPADRIETAATLAKQYHMGMEMEFDERMNTDPTFRQKYIEYLNGGIDYGYMKNAFKAYYQGNTALFDSAKSQDPAVRELYDFMYQFVKGTYVKQTP